VISTPDWELKKAHEIVIAGDVDAELCPQVVDALVDKVGVRTEDDVGGVVVSEVTSAFLDLHLD